VIRRIPSRRRPGPRRAVLIAAAAGALILAGLGYLAVTAENGLPLVSYYDLNADFRNAAELDPYSEVRIAGTLAGQVLGTSFEHGHAVVQMQLNTGDGPLRSSTMARIRLQGLIGAKYVELTPGRTGPELPSGGTLPLTQTSTSVDVFDVLAIFDAERRAALQATLGALGQGLLGRGAQLNDAIGRAPTLAANLDAVATAVNDRAGSAERLVPGVESLTAALEPVRSELAAGWDPATRALTPLTDQRSSVHATRSESPNALGVIRSGLAQTDPLLAQVSSLSRALIALTRPAPAALEQATALLRSARRPLATTDTLVRVLADAIPPTIHLLTGVGPLAAPGARAFDNALPGLTNLGRYQCDIARWAQNYSALFALGSPPDTSAGPVGLLRGAFVTNPNTIEPDRPGVVPAAWYAAPCTADLQRLP
jgi:ABC-type transporter Mla subunit MlaD